MLAHVHGADSEKSRQVTCWTSTSLPCDNVLVYISETLRGVYKSRWKSWSGKNYLHPRYPRGASLWWIWWVCFLPSTCWGWRENRLTFRVLHSKLFICRDQKLLRSPKRNSPRVAFLWWGRWDQTPKCSHCADRGAALLDLMLWRPHPLPLRCARQNNFWDCSKRTICDCSKKYPIFEGYIELGRSKHEYFSWAFCPTVDHDVEGSHGSLLSDWASTTSCKYKCLNNGFLLIPNLARPTRKLSQIATICAVLALREVGVRPSEHYGF